VVNSAALFDYDDAATFSPASLERHLRPNASAPILLAQALAAHLGERGAPAASGCVVNLLDQKLFNPNPDFFSYTLSKATLACATTLLAQALAPTVRVAGVAPGLTLASHLMNPARFAELHAQSPLGRSSTPEDVAAAVVFALGNASITGATLLVDGGQHLMRFERDFSMMDEPAVPVSTAGSAASLEAPEPPPATDGGQILSLTGLRFDANLGILDQEKSAPQPIQVDAELNLGPQPLAPRDDDIRHVLDYRKVRQIIIDECTARHVNLLESLVGKLCARLLQLPGVQGVRVKITKLEIFGDCEVAIRMEAGNWSRGG
jgi:dihydroneopterin aldolase